jgi:hypothetical protein
MLPSFTDFENPETQPLHIAAPQPRPCLTTDRHRTPSATAALPALLTTRRSSRHLGDSRHPPQTHATTPQTRRSAAQRVSEGHNQVGCVLARTAPISCVSCFPPYSDNQSLSLRTLTRFYPPGTPHRLTNTRRFRHPPQTHATTPQKRRSAARRSSRHLGDSGIHQQPMSPRHESGDPPLCRTH